MPAIPRRTPAQKERVKVTLTLTREQAETLERYAQFLDENPDYVVGRLAEFVLAKDKDYLAWAGPQTPVPTPPHPRVQGPVNGSGSSRIAGA